MATTSDYLNKLIEQKNVLVDNLIEKGISASYDEALETLIPKVLNIQGGSGNGIYPVGENGRPTGDAVVPAGVTSIVEKVFDYTDVTSVILPEGLTKIGNSGFRYCTSLEKVTLPSTLENIGSSSFYMDSKLQQIILNGESKVSSIDSQAFYGCSLLSSDSVNKILKNITNLGTSVFYGCNGLTEIEIPFMNGNVFQNCKNLKKATVLRKNSNGIIGISAFSDCSSLEELSLPEDYITISNYMVSNTALSTFFIPKTVTSIGASAFSRCPNLSNIAIDEEANFSLNSYCFEYCSSLTNEDVENIISHIDVDKTSSSCYGLFSYCTGITDVTVKTAVGMMFKFCTNLIYAKILQPFKDSIPHDLFYGCSALETCYLPDGATTIRTNIFYNCSALKTVYLPSSITTAASNSLSQTNYHIFKGCTALEDVQLGADWNMDLLLNMSENLTVDSMVAMFESLKDLTGDTAKTLTLGEVNLAKLTDEQKAVALNKNWILA